ncbi:MAG: hypothetical protein ABR606_14030 [Vicinamibacterales bacterium]
MEPKDRNEGADEPQKEHPGQDAENIGTANDGDEQAPDIVSRVGEESPDVEHDQPDHPKSERKPL